jgi:hypothetical protein
LAFYDVFNGDADGLCALHQLRQAEPRDAVLLTGAKRETALVARISARAGDDITVLDLPLDRNRAALAAALEAGARVHWFDHHRAETVPRHAGLVAVIDTAPDTCTSLLVNRHLEGRYRAWAVVAAFGDNLIAAAEAAAVPLNLERHRVAQLRELGECLNYNAYGESVADLHYDPLDLYAALLPYSDPLEFIAGEPVLDVLRAGRDDDLDRADSVVPYAERPHSAVYVLPDAAWARRASGVLANRLAREHPQRAHAVLTTRPDGFVVSVRAPLGAPHRAAELCGDFGGGGRAGAGGIDHLTAGDLDRFVAALEACYA